MTGYETYTLINHCGKCYGRYSNCAKECPYYTLCKTYQKSIGFTTQKWLKKQKKNPEFFKALCALYDIPVYTYDEDGYEVLYMLSDLHHFYENQFDEAQKKAGTDFVGWMHDCERANLLIRVQQDSFSFPILNFRRIQDIMSYTPNTSYQLYVRSFNPEVISCWLVRRDKEAALRKRWSYYDEITAKVHMENYGVIILNSYNHSLNDENNLHPLNNENDLKLVCEKLSKQ